MTLNVPIQTLGRDLWDFALPVQAGGTVDAAATLVAKTRDRSGTIIAAVDTDTQSLVCTVVVQGRPEAVYVVSAMDLATALHDLHQTRRALGVASL